MLIILCIFFCKYLPFLSLKNRNYFAENLSPKKGKTHSFFYFKIINLILVYVLLFYDVLTVFLLFLSVANIITSVICASRVAFSTVGSSSSK